MNPKLAGAAMIAATLLVGCGSSSSDGPAAAPAVAKVAIEDFKFAPERVSVGVGAKVTFTNADRAPHTATMKPAFDTGVLRKGESKTITIAAAGTFAYICDLHPYMKATLVAE